VHLSVILSARRAFDARTGVDAPGVSQLDGPRDVGCIQAAGHNDASGRSGGQTPIERAAAATVELRGRPIQEQRFRRAVVVIGEVESFVYARGLPNGESGGVIGGRFVA